VRIHSGSVIGDGFGFAPILMDFKNSSNRNVIIEDDVDIGACTLSIELQWGQQL
jgi:UDP-3-O-[3-hydroxymyristoyl] glucosamine N-acyltransferase